MTSVLEHFLVEFVLGGELQIIDDIEEFFLFLHVTIKEVLHLGNDGVESSLLVSPELVIEGPHFSVV